LTEKESNGEKKKRKRETDREVKQETKYYMFSLRSTSAASFIRAVIRAKIFVLEGPSGTGKEISLENLPLTPASNASALKLIKNILNNLIFFNDVLSIK
jgi:putative ribosome biogenesis GTPase RsgA